MIIDSRPVSGFLRFRVYKCFECGFTDITEERLPVDESLYEKTTEKFSKRYRGSPKEKQLARQRDYFKQRRKTDSKFKLRASVSSSIGSSLKGNKAGRHWEDLVGYTLNDLKKHLEKLFVEGMTWENYGEWHIDHKVPVSAFNFTKPEHIDFKKCWALKNLQPLWALDNWSKNNKLTKQFQPSLKV